jgi:hypothetical protein
MGWHSIATVLSDLLLLNVTEDTYSRHFYRGCAGDCYQASNDGHWESN